MLTSPVPCGEEYLYCEEGSVRPKYAKEGWFTTGKYAMRILDMLNFLLSAYGPHFVHQEALRQLGTGR